MLLHRKDPYLSSESPPPVLLAPPSSRYRFSKHVCVCAPRHTLTVSHAHDSSLQEFDQQQQEPMAPLPLISPVKPKSEERDVGAGDSAGEVAWNKGQERGKRLGQ